MSAAYYDVPTDESPSAALPGPPWGWLTEDTLYAMQRRRNLYRRMLASTPRWKVRARRYHAHRRDVWDAACRLLVCELDLTRQQRVDEWVQAGMPDEVDG